MKVMEAEAVAYEWVNTTNQVFRRLAVSYLSHSCHLIPFHFFAVLETRSAINHKHTPPRKLTHPLGKGVHFERNVGNHLQKCLGRGYVSSQADRFPWHSYLHGPFQPIPHFPKRTLGRQVTVFTKIASASGD